MDKNIFKKVRIRGRKTLYRCMACGKEIKNDTFMYHDGDRVKNAEVTLCESCRNAHVEK